MSTLYIVVPIGAALIAAVFILFILRKKGDKKEVKNKNKKVKDRNTIVREANRRLAQNPKDPEALLLLADIYYSDQTYEKAMRTYQVLIDLCGTNTELDEFEVTLRYALSAMQIKQYQEAYKSFLIARTMKQDVFEIEHNLGHLEYLNKNYEKAAGYLSKAKVMKPDNLQTLRLLGLSLFRIRRYQDGAIHLRKALDMDPEDKEALFCLGQCYHNLGQNEPAVKIFAHLRVDPLFGPHAALYSGTIHLNAHDTNKAIMDFEIGLRHEQIKQEVRLELMYRLATAYIKNQDLPNALNYFQQIRSIQPDYKDVKQQLENYSELNRNKNLQVFLLSPISDFVALCRKLTTSFFPDAKVKILDISVQKNDYADILTEVSTTKWEDIVLFRFVRTSGDIGELILRDLYSRIKEVKAGRGYCITTGTFTESAQHFVEARLIDLIEKDKLMEKLLHTNY
ncbi:MAG: tetratricopeptide repeat protein [Spirochaetales bacterium]|nr:tetratricopeptide repeat protein [Spirochaetales bacterium]